MSQQLSQYQQDMCIERQPGAGRLEVALKTRGEIEAAVSEGIARFEQEYTGRGPRDIRAELIDDRLVVRLQGVPTAAEERVARALSDAKGRELLKQVRAHLIEAVGPMLGAMVQGITGSKVVGLQHGIESTGEKLMVFTLAEPPLFRDTKRGVGPLSGATHRRGSASAHCRSTAVAWRRESNSTTRTWSTIADA